MDRDLALPALVLLDEVGAGTDPVEGGALGIAVIDHFRKRGAHLVATTHYDSLKSYASTTEGVDSAAFGFNPETFAPTYRLIYGSPGRSLAIEIAARLGMPPAVIAAAREQPDASARSSSPSTWRAWTRTCARSSRSAASVGAASARRWPRPRQQLRAREDVGARARGDVPPAARRQARRAAARRAARDRRRSSRG